MTALESPVGERRRGLLSLEVNAVALRLCLFAAGPGSCGSLPISE